MSKSEENRNVAGYEFVCKNEKCKCFNTGFSLYKEWPIAYIDHIINSKSITQDIKEHLYKNKYEGRKYALVTLPNTENIKIIGKRIQLFCQKDGIIWEREIVDKNHRTFYDKGITDLYCDKCKERLITADEARENGIMCPSCKEKLICSIWFSKM
jgi:hypothetical protein